MHTSNRAWVDTSAVGRAGHDLGSRLVWVKKGRTPTFSVNANSLKSINLLILTMRCELRADKIGWQTYGGVDAPYKERDFAMNKYF